MQTVGKLRARQAGCGWAQTAQGKVGASNDCHQLSNLVSCQEQLRLPTCSTRSRTCLVYVATEGKRMQPGGRLAQIAGRVCVHG